MNDITLEDGRSSSLPSPEEAKSHAVMMKDGSSTTIDSSIMDGSDSFRISNNDGADLPSVEEALMNASRSASCNKRTLGIVALALILIVGLIATVVSVVPKGGDGGGSDESSLEFGGELGNFPVLTDTEDGSNDAPKFTANLRTPAPTASPTSPPVMTTTPAPNISPTTEQPTVSRYESIKSILINQGVSTATDLTRADSSQEKALQWIVDDDVPSNSSPNNIAKLVQRYVLAVLFYEAGKSYWRQYINFMNPNKDECDWFAFFKLYGKKQMGVTCNQDGMVQALNIRKYAMVAMLPCSITSFLTLFYPRSDDFQPQLKIFSKEVYLTNLVN